MKKKILISMLLIGAITAYFVYSYVMQAPKNIATSKTDFTVVAKTFAEEFTANEKTATLKYQEKVIIVNGQITSMENSSITLDSKITCGFASKTELKIGDKVKIKGLFIGFDEMFEEVKLDKCSLVK